MNRIAMTVVIFPSTVGVPIEPNTAWVPAPPNADPMSAPLPACSRTIPIMATHMSAWTTISAMYIYSPVEPVPARAARLTIETNADALRLAPPTSVPSISGSATSDSIFSGFTLPPYKIRIV
jgi:hypothetical protein